MIKRLHVSGFQSHADTTLELVPGVNVIVGDSNVGKTAILRALRWVVENRPRGTADIVTRQPTKKKGKKACRVEVETDRGTITRLRDATFNGYLVKRGKGVERRFSEVGTSVPPEVAEVLNLADINSQSQLADFFLITQPAGQVSRYVSSLLGFGVLDEAQRLAKSEVTRLGSRREMQTQDLVNVKAELASLGDLDSLAEDVDGLLALLDQASAVASSREKLTTLLSNISTLELEVAALSNMDADIDVSEVEEKYDVLYSAMFSRNKIEMLITSITTLTSEIEGLQENARKLDRKVDARKKSYAEDLAASGVCPFCGAPSADQDLSVVNLG